MPVPVEMTLDPHHAGDHWEGADIGPITIDYNDDGVYVAPDYALASARWQFRPWDDLDTLSKGLATGAEIVIDDADTWELTIAPLILGLTPGKYRWAFETIDVNGGVLTPYAGFITINPDPVP